MKSAPFGVLSTVATFETDVAVDGVTQASFEQDANAEYDVGISTSSSYSFGGYTSDSFSSDGFDRNTYHTLDADPKYDVSLTVDYNADDNYGEEFWVAVDTGGENSRIEGTRTEVNGSDYISWNLGAAEDVVGVYYSGVGTTGVEYTISLSGYTSISTSSSYTVDGVSKTP